MTGSGGRMASALSCAFEGLKALERRGAGFACGMGGRLSFHVVSTDFTVNADNRIRERLVEA